MVSASEIFPNFATIACARLVDEISPNPRKTIILYSHVTGFSLRKDRSKQWTYSGGFSVVWQDEYKRDFDGEICLVAKVIYPVLNASKSDIPTS